MMSDGRMVDRDNSDGSRSDSFVERLKLQRSLEGGASMSVHGGQSPALVYVQWYRSVSRNARIQTKRKANSVAGDAQAASSEDLGIQVAKRVPPLQQSVLLLHPDIQTLRASREASN
jgi:hypothetical protein